MWQEYKPTIVKISINVSRYDAAQAAAMYSRWIESIGLGATVTNESYDGFSPDGEPCTVTEVSVAVHFRNEYFAQGTQLFQAVRKLGLLWRSYATIQAPLTGTILHGDGDDLAVLMMVAECNYHSALRNGKAGIGQIGWLINAIVEE